MLIVDAITSLLSLTRSLGSDEALNYFIASNGVSDIVASSLMIGQSPVYYLLLKGWATMLGSSEMVLRGFSLLASGISIVYIHHILIDFYKTSIKKSYKDLLFFALNPVFLFLAFQVSPQMMFVCLSIMSFYYLLVRKHRTYVAMSIIAGLTNWSFLFIVLLQGLYFVLVQHGSMKKFLTRSGPSIIVTTTLFIFMLLQDPNVALSNMMMTAIVILMTFVLSLGVLHIFNYGSSFTRATTSISLAVLTIAFLLFVNETNSVNMKSIIMDINSINSSGDKVYVKDPSLFFPASYYYKDQVFVYADTSKTISENQQTIPTDNFTKKLPVYPTKAFVIDGSGQYEAMASY